MRRQVWEAAMAAPLLPAAPSAASAAAHLPAAVALVAAADARAVAAGNGTGGPACCWGTECDAANSVATTHMMLPSIHLMRPHLQRAAEHVDHRLHAAVGGHSAAAQPECGQRAMQLPQRLRLHAVGACAGAQGMACGQRGRAMGGQARCRQAGVRRQRWPPDQHAVCTWGTPGARVSMAAEPMAQACG